MRLRSRLTSACDSFEHSLCSRKSLACQLKSVDSQSCGRHGTIRNLYSASEIGLEMLARLGIYRLWIRHSDVNQNQAHSRYCCGITVDVDRKRDGISCTIECGED